MFNWTTTTIINSLKDVNGKDIVKVWKGAETLEGGSAAVSGQAPVLKIKKDFTFEKRYITKIFKEAGSNPELCKLTVDGAKLRTAVRDANKTVHARLAIYITLEGSNESIYANSSYKQKGKPFSIGFDVNPADTAEVIIKKIISNANRYGVITYGKKVLDFSVTGTGNSANLVISGAHEYQRFGSVAIAIDNDIEENIVAYFDGFDDTTTEADMFTLTSKGKNGFGTYNHLVKDLRLPTPENTRWLSKLGDDRPVIGALYTQYIINYCAPSMANPGLTTVGQHGMSATTHVFWIREDLVSAFETKLGSDFDIENAIITPTAGVYSTNHTQEIIDVAPATIVNDGEGEP